MECHEPWLTCRRKGKVYLLAKSESGYYAIEVGKRLDYATEDWLQQQGVSEELLKELRLIYIWYPQNDLRGVAVGGAAAGDMICLYPKSGNRHDYTLELDYDETVLEEFFGGICRFQPPKKKEPKQTNDWRKVNRDPELFEKLRFVSPACVALNICAVCGYLKTDHWVWFTLCLICLSVQLGLAIGMPAYFTIVSQKKDKKYDVWELEIPLFILFLGIVFRNNMNWMSGRDYLIALLIGAVAGLVLYVLLRDLREMKCGILVAVLLGALVGAWLIGQVNRVYDFKEPNCYILEVEDMHSNSGRRHTSYYCTVTLPDGRKENLAVTRRIYGELYVGGPVRVEHSVGVLGIEYANVYAVD